MSNDADVMTGAASREKLLADLRVLVGDTEDLLRATASQAGEKVTAARERIQASLANAKVKLAEAERVVVDRTKQAAHVTDQYVHEHPWSAVGIATAIGLVLGLLISRR
jgi:ElaB/YqjD/DUF883 family membrane-anchored ribosome-binding protein